MSTIKIEVTKNFYDVDLQQNVTSYYVTLEKGYYPLPVGGGGDRLHRFGAEDAAGLSARAGLCEGEAGPPAGR